MFLTISEFAPIVVFPASSIVGSPVLKLVLGSVFAGAGQARSIPVPPLLAVAVEMGATGRGHPDAAGGAAATGDARRLAFRAFDASVPETTRQRHEANTP